MKNWSLLATVIPVTVQLSAMALEPGSEISVAEKVAVREVTGLERKTPTIVPMGYTFSIRNGELSKEIVVYDRDGVIGLLLLEIYTANLQSERSNSHDSVREQDWGIVRDALTKTLLTIREATPKLKWEFHDLRGKLLAYGTREKFIELAESQFPRDAGFVAQQIAAFDHLDTISTMGEKIIPDLEDRTEAALLQLAEWSQTAPSPKELQKQIFLPFRYIEYVAPVACRNQEGEFDSILTAPNNLGHDYSELMIDGLKAARGEESSHRIHISHSFIEVLDEALSEVTKEFRQTAGDE